ncbi:MAG: ATP-binding protein [Gammaproteobacteria bacterium]|nr:ATP-binding protein [Gammaproteobacteria bacterium]
MSVQPMRRISYPLLTGGFLCAGFGLAGLCGLYFELPCLIEPLRALTPLSITPALSLLIAGSAALILGLGYRRTALVFSVLGFVVATVLGLAASPYVHGELHSMLRRVNEIRGAVVWSGPLSDGMVLVATLGLALTAARRMPLAAGLFGALLLAFSLAALLGQFSPVWPIWDMLGLVAPQMALALFVLSLALLREGWQGLRNHPRGFALLTAIGFIAVSVALAGAVRTYEQAQLRQRSRAAAYSVADQLASAAGRPAALQSVVSRWEMFGMPSRHRAQQEAKLVMRQMPEIVAMGWIAPSMRPVWWQAMRPPQGVIVEPLLARHLQREQILTYTRSQRHMVMTPPVQLLRGNKGFIVIAPIYQNGRMRGYLVSVFDAYRWLAHLITRQVTRGYYVRIFYDNILLFERGARGFCRYAQRVHVRMLGQRFTVAVCPQPRVVKATDVGLATIVLMSGVLLALFAAAAVYAMQRARWHAQSLDAMNNELEMLVASRTAALEDERERWRVTLMSIGDGVILTDAEGGVALVNEAAEHLTGWPGEAARGQPLSSVLPLRDAITRAWIETPRAAQWGDRGAVTHSAGAVFKDRGGREHVVSDSIAPVHDGQGRVAGFIVVFRDMTEHKALEEEALKARSLEALGVLAGGIAHDFNNILTAIIGNVALGKIYAMGDKRLLAVLDDAEQSGWRARGLTLQLLTFAKGGAPVLKTGPIAETVRALVTFFLKGSRVRATVDLPDDLWPVDFDRDQIGQVVQNLVLNAIEAMGEGGALVVRGANVTLEAGEVAELAAGPYVAIAFADNGRGIEKEFLDRIFDPYFSLKATGTGLGLAVTYSIMRRHHGAITARSTAGQGTTMTLYLPRSYEAAKDASAMSNPRQPVGHGEWILLMDDDDSVRKIGKALLMALGYQVEEAANGGDALMYFRENPDRFAAVVLDLTVAGGMGGEHCLAELKKIRPGVRALVATGYSTDPVVARFRDYGFVGAIQKPYRLDDLASIMASVLSGPPPGASPRSL